MKEKGTTQESEKVKKKKINISKETRFMIIAILSIIIFSIALTPVTLQNDTFYTIKIGEHIKNYGVDMKDPFSWHQGLPYTYPHWLYDLLTYYIYAFFCMQGIYIVTCILSCVLGLSLFFVAEKLNKNKAISFIVTIGAMYVLKPYIAARAQLVTFILFIWTIYFIEKFIETKKIRHAIALIIIPILIANLHVAVWPFYFVLYLPYVAEYLLAVITDTVLYSKLQMAVLNLRIKRMEKVQAKGRNIKEEKLQKLRENKKELEAQTSKIKIRREESNRKPYKIKMVRNKNVKYLIIIMIICVFTGLLTPIGDAPYTYLYKTMIGNTTQSINEHLPMTLVENVEAMCMIVIFLAILTFTKTKVRLSDLFFIGGLCYLMLMTRRQITMFAIIGTVILTRMLIDMFREYKVPVDKFLEVLVKPLVSLFIVVLIVFISYKIIKPKLNDEYISKSSYPIEACDFILENVDLGKARFYNEYNYGSYMLFRGIPVFIDSRADLYAPEFNGLDEDIFSDFINVSGISTFYEDIFEKYNITHVITYKSSKMNMIIKKTNDENYKQIYEDNYFTVYERLNVKNESEQNEENTEIEQNFETVEIDETVGIEVNSAEY